MANYATMKKDDLIALAKEKGIDADASMTKAEIIALINGAEKSAETAEVSTEKSAETAEISPEKSAETAEISPEKRDETAEKSPENVEAPAVDPVVEALKAQNELLQRQMEELQRQILSLQKPQVIQVTADTERVHFLWQADVADYNLVTFGPGGMYGSITGKTGTFSVPKNELSRILDDRTRRMIANRWLIVVDGLTDEERESLGVAYREGELLDRKVFAKMVELPREEICEIFPKLCDSHKEMVGRRFYEEWQNRNEAVTRDKVIALRNLVRSENLDIPAFQQILLEMNAAEEEA